MEQVIARWEAETTAITMAPLEKSVVTVNTIPVEDDTEDLCEELPGENENAKRTIEIQVFDPRTKSANKTFPVSILDCIMPRMLVPITCTYQLNNSADKESILVNICEGLRKLLEEYEFLAGSLHEPQDGGRAFVNRTASHSKFTVHIEDLAVSHPDFPSYTQLKEQHFPPSQLDRMLPPLPNVVSQLGEGTPVMAVQLNLIRGGLIIGVAVHHLLVDARGLDVLLARWAAHTRSVFDPARFPPLSPLLNQDVNTSVLVNPASDEGKHDVDYHKQAVPSLKYAPNGPSPPSISLTDMDQHIWHIPASKLAALKNHAAPMLDDEDKKWVSTNDCITALMWRAITRSRLASYGIDCPQDDPRPVALENSLDARSAFRSLGGVPESYAGNVVMFSKAEMPLCQLIAQGTFRAVALKVRQAVEEYRSLPTVRLAMEWIAACPRGADVEMDVEAIGGLDVVTTSWRVLKAYEHADFGFGPLMGLRWAGPVIDGYCFLFPKRPSGEEDEGVEIFLGLESGCMNRLLLDEELAQWANVRA